MYVCMYLCIKKQKQNKPNSNSGSLPEFDIKLIDISLHCVLLDILQSILHEITEDNNIFVSNTTKIKLKLIN